MVCTILFLSFIYLSTLASKYITSSNSIQSNISDGDLRRPDAINYRTSAIYGCCSDSLTKYMVSLRKFENDNNFGHKHFCGGVILRANLILTAAHCLIRNKQIIDLSSIRVVARTPVRLRKTAETQVLKVKKIIIHELFLNYGIADIALLKLREHIKLDRTYAAAVNMPRQMANISTVCTVLGWGKVYFHGPLANEILQLNVTLHSKEFCKPYFMGTEESKICASVRMDGQKSPCEGDSGGPLLCEGVLTGIVSYGFKCSYGLPTVYTDVYEQRNWIKQNTANAVKYWHMILLSFLPFAILLIINY